MSSLGASARGRLSIVFDILNDKPVQCSPWFEEKKKDMIGMLRVKLYDEVQANLSGFFKQCISILRFSFGEESDVSKEMRRHDASWVECQCRI